MAEIWRTILESTNISVCIQVFNKYLLDYYYLLGGCLDTEEGNNTKGFCSLREMNISYGRW